MEESENLTPRQQAKLTWVANVQARPIYHRKRESIEAHLSVVFAALAVTRFVEDRTS